MCLGKSKETKAVYEYVLRINFKKIAEMRTSMENL